MHFLLCLFTFHGFTFRRVQSFFVGIHFSSVHFTSSCRLHSHGTEVTFSRQFFPTLAAGFHFSFKMAEKLQHVLSVLKDALAFIENIENRASSGHEKLPGSFGPSPRPMSMMDITSFSEAASQDFRYV